MSTPGTLHSDHVYEALAARQHVELRFRSAVITSTAVHAAATIVLLLAPLFIPQDLILNITPVNLVQLEAPTPTPAPPAAPPQPEATVEEEPEPLPAEPEPELEELLPPPPEDVPEDLEAQRIKEEEAAARRREEERIKRAEDEARRKAAEEAARRRAAEEEARRRREEEEERRRAPQAASRSAPAPEKEPTEVVQQAARGSVGMLLADESGSVSDADMAFLNFWITQVLSKINSNWDPPARASGSREIVVVIHFRVDRNGRLIEGPDVFTTSSNRSYDAAAVRAVQSGLPFPPLPQAYRGRNLAINLGFKQ